MEIPIHMAVRPYDFSKVSTRDCLKLIPNIIQLFRVLVYTIHPPKKFGKTKPGMTKVNE